MTEDSAPQERSTVVQIQATLHWEAGDTHIEIADIFNLHSATSDGLILSVGQVAQPILLGDESSQMEQASRIREINVTTLGRYFVTESNMRQLHELLERILERNERNKLSG